MEPNPPMQTSGNSFPCDTARTHFPQITEVIIQNPSRNEIFKKLTEEHLLKDLFVRWDIFQENQHGMV